MYCSLQSLARTAYDQDIGRYDTVQDTSTVPYSRLQTTSTIPYEVRYEQSQSTDSTSGILLHNVGGRLTVGAGDSVLSTPVGFVFPRVV